MHRALLSSVLSNTSTIPDARWRRAPNMENIFFISLFFFSCVSRMIFHVVEFFAFSSFSPPVVLSFSFDFWFSFYAENIWFWLEFSRQLQAHTCVISIRNCDEHEFLCTQRLTKWNKISHYFFDEKNIFAKVMMMIPNIFRLNSKLLYFVVHSEIRFILWYGKKSNRSDVASST